MEPKAIEYALECEDREKEFSYFLCSWHLEEDNLAPDDEGDEE
jgi:hypothetical protein